MVPETVPLARLLGFIAVVIGAPTAAFIALAPRNATEAGPAMLVFILAPALAGLALSRGLPRDTAPRRWPGVGVAVALTALIVALSTAVACAAGVLIPGPSAGHASAVGPAVATALLTSTLEELGWASGGLAIARAALPGRVAVVALGIVWTAWHLVVGTLAPPEVAVGMFPLGDPLSPAPLIGFLLGCVAYRFLLTELRDRSHTVWAAAAAHATGNVILGGVVLGAGLAHFSPEGPWWAFPGPTGLVFAVAPLATFVFLRRHKAG